MRDAIVLLYEHLRNVNAIRVVVLTETEACCCCEPRDVLITLPALDIVSSSHELRLSHIHCNFHLLLVAFCSKFK